MEIDGKGNSSHDLMAIRPPVFVLLLMLGACAEQSLVQKPEIFQTSLMRAPVMFQDGETDPYRDTNELHRSNPIEVYYATDRNVASPGQPQPYGEEPGNDVRVGTATVQVGKSDLDWATFHSESLKAERTHKLPPEFVSVEELGALSGSLHFLAERPPEVRQPDRRFAELINARLSASSRPHIFVYVSQFLTGFEETVLISAELFHFLGQDGAFILYSWPSPTSTLAYFAAAENAYSSVRNLRIFIEFLARETHAEQIHLMTYSAGARVLAGALKELRLIYDDESEAELRERLRIGQVIFAAPDIAQELMRDHYEDGLADLATQVTTYTTTRDQALGLSGVLQGGTRLGTLQARDFAPGVISYLQEKGRTSFIDVTRAERIEELGAHGYFHASPWVSSDVVLILRSGLPPSQRGLIRVEVDPIWQFPDDYPERVGEIARRTYNAESVTKIK